MMAIPSPNASLKLLPSQVLEPGPRLARGVCARTHPTGANKVLPGGAALAARLSGCKMKTKPEAL